MFYFMGYDTVKPALKITFIRRLKTSGLPKKISINLLLYKTTTCPKRPFLSYTGLTVYVFKRDILV